MSVLRRKTTPKRLRRDFDLIEDDDILPCGTFVDIKSPSTSDANSGDTTSSTVYLDESAGSKAATNTTTSSSLSVLNSSPDTRYDKQCYQINRNKPSANVIDDDDDDDLNNNDQIYSNNNIQQKKSRISNSPAKVPVVTNDQQPKSIQMPSINLINVKPVTKLQQPQHQDNRVHGDSHSKIDQIQPSTSTPKSKHISFSTSSNQMTSLKPLAKSVSNQVYLMNKTHFNWDVYLELCPADVAPKEAFKQTRESLENKFELDMKLEAKDPRGDNVWSVATVVGKEGLRIKLRLDGGDKLNDFYELIDSANIRPCQSVPNEMLFAPVGYRGDISNYSNFVQKIFTNQDTVFATQDIFAQTPPTPPKNLFEPGMKLEAIDDKNPHMISPATVSQVLDNSRIKVIFDGWSEAYAIVYRFDSRHLFPVNWCRDTGHQIVPPLRWDKFLEDGQPLVDMDKILLKANNQNSKINTSKRTSRSKSLAKSSKKVSNKKKSKKSSKKLVKKKAKEAVQTEAKKETTTTSPSSSSSSTTTTIAPRWRLNPIQPKCTPLKPRRKQSPQKHQEQQVHQLPDVFTPQQIQQKIQELRMAKKIQAKAMQQDLVNPSSLVKLPDTLALLETISSDPVSTV